MNGTDDRTDERTSDRTNGATVSQFWEVCRFCHRSTHRISLNLTLTLVPGSGPNSLE